MDPTDPLTARLVLSSGVMLNLLETFDDLGIDLKGAPKTEAEGMLKAFGPAAVFCALLQGSEQVRSLEVAKSLVQRFAEAGLARREKLLGALPIAQRVTVERHETERSAGPDRVLELFTAALADLDVNAVHRLWGTGGGLKTLGDQVGRATRGEDIDREALEQLTLDHEAAKASLSEPSEPLEALPSEALAIIGSVLAGVGADGPMLERVMASALPTEAPEGYAADALGTIQRDAPKVGRNDPCPCGSGRKFKKCHGRGGA
jgi:hypothetical protein